MNAEGFNSPNAEYIDSLFADYQRDPASVSAEWRNYFESLDGNGRTGLRTRTASQSAEDAIPTEIVERIVNAFRSRGHLIAKTNPLEESSSAFPELDPLQYGLTEDDMDRPITGHPAETLGQLLQFLRETYCGSIGVEFMHIDDAAVREWTLARFENAPVPASLTTDEHRRILSRLNEAVAFEETAQRRFVGAKTFSLEGSESLIPMLDELIELAGARSIDEIVIAMAHRGRLNVLANILNKSPAEIFRQPADADPSTGIGDGDVKYHLGHSTDRQLADGRTIHLSLCFNPSHLEYVNPVALGRLRAKQDRTGDEQRTRGMVLLIHGDAAFAGQGVVQETLNLGGLAGYTVGGAIHIVVNNQLGFTTPPKEGFSSRYATDVAKILAAPIFHVNGDDLDAVIRAARLAADFRAEFQRDIVIDLVGYRRRGHNETDEPAYTQPTMYRSIDARESIHKLHRDRLVQAGHITAADADADLEARFAAFRAQFDELRDDAEAPPRAAPTGIWAGYHGGLESPDDEVETAVDKEWLTYALRQTVALPETFQRHPRLERLAHRRMEMADGTHALDWSAAEALAFASLAASGVRIRLSGQDTARGTFSHRHATLHDFESGETFVPLQQVTPDQAPVEIINSPLSEAAVLGFEYGYSLESPDALVMWEAQFGDFINAAQVIVDQFLTSAEDKWHRLSGLVLLLPHGWEGQGPEHSSARLERFLLAAAENNIQIVVPSTPANYFHLLRRQVLRPWRKPLIVFTPKSLLRHPQATSALDDLASGRFERVIPDRAIEPKIIRRILLCSGKIYYELVAAREAAKRTDVAIIRIEQLYPWRNEDLEHALAGYADGVTALWIQEEPRNMGAWRYIRQRCGLLLLGRFPFSAICPRESASPATGSSAIHHRRQTEIINAALAATP